MRRWCEIIKCRVWETLCGNVMSTRESNFEMVGKIRPDEVIENVGEHDATADRNDAYICNVWTLTFGNICPAERDMFGSVSKSVFFGECDSAFTIFIHDGRLCLDEAEFGAELT